MMVNVRKIDYHVLWAINTGKLFDKYFSKFQKKHYTLFHVGTYDKAAAIKEMIGIIPDILRYHKLETGCYHHFRKAEAEMLAAEIVELLTCDFQCEKEAALSE